MYNKYFIRIHEDKNGSSENSFSYVFEQLKLIQLSELIMTVVLSSSF